MRKRQSKLLLSALVTAIVVALAVLVTGRPRLAQPPDSLEFSRSSNLGEANRSDIDPMMAKDVVHDPVVVESKLVFGLSGPTQVTMQEPVERVDGRLIDHYDVLAERAANGDAGAAMQLGYSLSICDAAPSTPVELDKWVSQIGITYADPKTGRESNDPAKLAERYRKDFSFCEGVTDDHVAETAHWIQLASANGNPEALANYMNAVSLSIETRVAANQRIWATREIEIADTVLNAMKAADAGSAEGMIRLAQLAEKGFVPELSETERIAYFVAGVAAKQAAGHSVYFLLPKAKERLVQVSVLEKAQILARSQQLLDRNVCCFFVNKRITTGEDQ